MAYTLGQAAKAVHRNKTTLLRAIKSGKISAVCDAATGGWLIEPAELHRLYPAAADAALQSTPDTASRSTEAAIEIRELRARLADSQDQVADLRRRLDMATGQLGDALQQVRALTDQRARPDLAAEPPAPVRRWWRWRQ